MDMLSKEEPLREETKTNQNSISSTPSSMYLLYIDDVKDIA